MRQFWHWILFLSIILLSSYGYDSKAQDQYGITLKEGLNAVGDKYNVMLFYLPEWIDTIRVKPLLVELNLKYDLKYLLDQAQLQFIEYSEDQIFIIKSRQFMEAEYLQMLPEFRIYDQDTKFLLSGTVSSEKDDEYLIGATIYIEELDTGTITNLNGEFSILLPSGKYHIQINSVGQIQELEEVEMVQDSHIEVAMTNRVIELQEVVVREESVDVNVSSVYSGINKLNIQTIKFIPAFMGESDVLRSLLMMPGVSSVGEASTGFNVRGGGSDQNLILLDETPIFNSSHLFGLFSAFNQDAVDNVTLLKGGIPAKYGGRLSSVLEVNTTESVLDKFSMKGGIGIVTSRLTLDVPIIKEKMSVLLAGRSSYSDFALGFFPNESIQESSAFFYDANLKFNYRINEKNNLQFSYYSSYDKFKFPTDTTYEWGTYNASLRWNHLFNEKLVGNFILAYTNFDYGLSDPTGVYNFNWDAGIDYLNGQANFTFFGGDKHRIDFGGSIIKYTFYPGSLLATPESSINEDRLEPEYARESAVYAGDEFTLSKRIGLMYGLRFSYFENIGPATVYQYMENIPKDETTVIDSTLYGKGNKVIDYYGIEPRLALKLNLNPTSSIKLSYNRMYQYLHLVSNTTSITPIDIWKPSGTHVRPQWVNQYSIGYFRNFLNNTIETSVELYYKSMYDIVDYKDGAKLFLNKTLEADLLQGEGRAYGVEVYARKNLGKLTGWISYTYARSERKIDGPSDEEKINGGNYYPSNYDKPHDLKLTTIYKFTRRWSFSANFIYSTGRPTTYPEGKYSVDGYTIADYGYRNLERIPDYHRLDISFTLLGNHKIKQRWKGSWTFSVYNVYGRQNAYSVYFKSLKGNSPKAYQLSILGSAFPAITYNFKFM